MKTLALLRETPGNTFQFIGTVEKSGRVIVVYETNVRGGKRMLELKTPESEEEKQQVLESVRRMDEFRRAKAASGS